MDINYNKLKRKQFFQNIDIEVFMEAVIEQMNSLRLQKVNLVQDMDDIVNEYLSVCKKHPIK